MPSIMNCHAAWQAAEYLRNLRIGIAAPNRWLITLPKKSTAARAAPVNTTRTLLRIVEMFRIETR
jgi:hypothetical protein